MATLPDLCRRFVDAAPSLQEWYVDARDHGYPSETWTLLTFDILDGSTDDVAHRLLAVAPLLEEALRDHDAHDQVSLGLVETMIREAESRRFDTLAIRQLLGPLARERWDELTDYLHQGNWVMVELRTAAVTGLPGFPVRFAAWQVQSGGSAPEGSVVATVHLGEIAYEVATAVACKVGRLAAQPGQYLGEGDLLCYLLPDDYRQFGRVSAYLTVRAVTTPHAA